MIFLETVAPKGIFRMTVKNRQGEVIESYEESNLVVAAGRVNLANLLASEVTNRFIKTIGFGTNGAAPTSEDTALTDAFTKDVDSSSISSSSVTFNWTLDYSEANGKNIAEFGLITAAGVLFARKSRGIIAKDSEVAIAGQWTIIF